MCKKIHKNITREEIINALIEKDIECITDDPTSIICALREGCVGYEKMNNEQLIEDYKIYCEDEESE